jgi:predicted nucleotidyltransferase
MLPPILLEALDPDNFEMAASPRYTGDCDVAIDIAFHGAERWRQIESLLHRLGFERDLKKNQFRWKHACGLKIDALPVPSGIERGDSAARAFGESFVRDDTQRFFHGYELALAEPVEISVELDDGETQSIRVAGVAACLVMKLQAWTDRRLEDKKDAHDLGWLLRYMTSEIIAVELRKLRDQWPERAEVVIARLEENFSDPEGRGTLDYVSQYANGVLELTERNRRALASAVAEVLRLYRMK